MNESISLSSYLPGVLAFLSDAWGVRMSTLLELPLMLSAGAALLVCVSAWRSSAREPRRFWRAVALGSGALAASLVLVWWSLAASRPALALLGSAVETGAILLLFGTLIFYTHTSYAASC